MTQLCDLHHVSVIIPAYNALELLKRTVKSLEEQIPDTTGLEVVVVDDASTDGTALWLNSYSGRLDLITVSNRLNLGRAATRNIGTHASKGELLIFIDGDMKFGKEFIQRHVNSHETENSVVIGSVVHHSSLGNKAYSRYLRKRGLFKLDSGKQVSGRYFLSGNSSLTRKLFDDVGGFDESIPYGEDIDFGMRLVNAGATFIYNQALTVTHLHSRSLKDNLKLMREFGRKSLPVLIKKHPELLEEFKLNWLNRNYFTRIVKRTLLIRPIYGLLYAFAYIFSNLAVPAFIYKYLLFYSYYNGYKASTEA